MLLFVCKPVGAALLLAPLAESAVPWLHLVAADVSLRALGEPGPASGLAADLESAPKKSIRRVI